MKQPWSMRSKVRLHRLYLHVWGFSDCCDSLPEGPTYISEAPRPKIKDLASKIF